MKGKLLQFIWTIILVCSLACSSNKSESSASDSTVIDTNLVDTTEAANPENATGK